MSLDWRNPQRNVISRTFKHNRLPYASFNKKPRSQSRSRPRPIQRPTHTLCTSELHSDIYSGTHGFRQKCSKCTPERDDPYKNFNVGSTKLRRTQTRCGIIAFNPSCEKVICIQNKTMFDKYGVVQWGLPKGHMEEKDRNYSSCASREFKEETGIIHRLDQRCHLFKRVNNTMYYPIIVSDRVRIAPRDTVEIMAAEWKIISQLTTLGIETKEHNQDLKVLLHRYINEIIIMAKKNNEISVNLKKK
jgi:ADP-ribose pyrophosphatase YjhB (NUDIX family)